MKGANVHTWCAKCSAFWCTCVSLSGLPPPATIVKPNGDLYKDLRLTDDFDGLIDWRVGDEKLSLYGDFSANELRAMADHMESTK